MSKLKHLAKITTKIKIKDFLFLLITLSLLKIAFYGADVNIKYKGFGGLPVNISIDLPVTIDGRVEVEGADLSNNPIDVFIKQ